MEAPGAHWGVTVTSPIGGLRVGSLHVLGQLANGDSGRGQKFIQPVIPDHRDEYKHFYLHFHCCAFFQKSHFKQRAGTQSL